MLVLYSDNRLLPGLAVIDETLDRVLRTQYEPEVELFNEFLDLESITAGFASFWTGRRDPYCALLNRLTGLRRFIGQSANAINAGEKFRRV